MAILFQTSGFPELKRFLGGMIARTRDTRPARKFIGEEMLHRNERRLTAGLDVHGRRMAPSARVRKSGGQTLMDKGALAASVNYELSGTGLDLFSSDPRARVHYEGLEIKPKAGKKFLTIPLRASGGMFAASLEKDQRKAQALGVAVRKNRGGLRASDYGRKTTFFKWVRGKLFLMQRVPGPGGNARLRALFLLVRSVRMKKREWMGFSENDVTMAAEVLGGHVTGERGGR